MFEVGHASWHKLHNSTPQLGQNQDWNNKDVKHRSEQSALKKENKGRQITESYHMHILWLLERHDTELLIAAHGLAQPSTLVAMP